MKSVVVVVLLTAALLLTSGVSFADSYGIILTDKPSQTMEHAGKELGKYLNLMTHAGVAMGESAGKADTVFILGDANPAVKSLKDKGKFTEPANWQSETNPDAYYLRSAADAGRHYVIIAGKNDVSTLYGVYGYLRRYGGCGFFQDGDYVPSKAPKVTKVDFFDKPRFSFRQYRGDLCASYGTKKFDWMFRNMDDWIPFYDWLAKRGINVSDYWPLMYGAAGGTPMEMAFGVRDDEKPGERYCLGEHVYSWPNAWTWPADYRTQMLHRRLGYHRMLGIKALIQRMYSHVPIPFKEQHPEYKYIDVGYGHAVLDPNQPIAFETSKRYCQALKDCYGTDHLWDDWPYAESPADADYDKGLQLKIRAAVDSMKTYQAADPEAVWVTDSWDIVGLTDFWTPERRQKYFDAVPTDKMLIADACVDLRATYQQCNYFYGTPWALGVIHTFQGDDHLHGNLKALIDTVQAAVNDPKSDKLQGYFHLPESHGSNMIFWQLSTELSWNPDKITLDGFLADYTRSRYGDESFKTMLEAQKAVVKGVYCGNGQKPFYRCYGNAAPMSQMQSLNDTIHLLKKAVDVALTQEDLQKDNPLYENDMLEWTKCYLGHLFNWETTMASRSLEMGRFGEVEKHTMAARRCMVAIENILSTRPDFSLQETINQAMAVPGTNPATPKMMRVKSVYAMYAANDVYEVMRLYYRPRMEAILKGIDEAAKKGSKEIDWSKVNPECGQIESRWMEQPCEVPASDHFKGTTMQAVRQAVDVARPLERRVSVDSFPRGWMSETSLGTECAEKPVSKGLDVISWSDGPAKIADYQGSKCWSVGKASPSAQPYLYVSANDNLVFDVRKPLTLAVEYFDEGLGEVGIHYDSTDETATYQGAYKGIPAFTLTDSKQWKTASVVLKDARFSSRQNGGADFRLYKDEGSLNIRKLTLSPGQPENLPVSVY